MSLPCLPLFNPETPTHFVPVNSRATFRLARNLEIVFFVRRTTNAGGLITHY
jgi:hypothetical protein